MQCQHAAKGMSADGKPCLRKTEHRQHLIQRVEMFVEREAFTSKIHAAAEPEQIRNNECPDLRQAIIRSAKRFAARNETVQENKYGIAGTRDARDQFARLGKFATAGAPHAHSRGRNVPQPPRTRNPAYGSERDFGSSPPTICEAAAHVVKKMLSRMARLENPACDMFIAVLQVQVSFIATIRASIRLPAGQRRCATRPG